MLHTTHRAPSHVRVISMPLRNQMSFLRLRADVHQSSVPVSCANMYVSKMCFIRTRPWLDAHAFAARLSTRFTSVTLWPSSRIRCCVTIPSAIPVLLRQSSSPQTVVLVDQAAKVALLPFYNSTARAHVAHGTLLEVAHNRVSCLSLVFQRKVRLSVRSPVRCTRRRLVPDTCTATSPLQFCTQLGSRLPARSGILSSESRLTHGVLESVAHLTCL